MYLDNSNNQVERFDEIIKMYHSADGAEKISPEMIQLMMMQNSMPSF